MQYLREQRRLQPLPGYAIERTARPVHRPRRTWSHLGRDRAAGTFDRLALQPDSLPGFEPAPRNHARGNRSAIRHLAAKCQPVSEAAGEGGVAQARIWRGLTIIDLERLRS